MRTVVVPDRADAAALFTAHAPGLFRLAGVLVGNAAIAEEVVQEAFVALVRASPPPASGKELAYLRRTVVNLTHGHHRRGGIARRFRPTPVADSPSAETEAVLAERQREVVAAVRRLPARQRDVVVLHYFLDMDVAGIAELLGVSSGTVKTHLHRARATLATHLGSSR